MAQRLSDDVYQISLDGWGFGGPDSVTFFLKPSRKKIKYLFLFPLKMSPTLILYFHSRIKTKRSLRSDVDRSTDRLTDKMTTVTLWHMHAEG